MTADYTKVSYTIIRIISKEYTKPWEYVRSCNKQLCKYLKTQYNFFKQKTIT